MPKYRVYIYERLIHTHEVDAPSEEAIEEMVGDMGFPEATETQEYALMSELTELIEEVE
jgi:hypothetical protein